MAKCANCGAELQEGANFCMECGERVEKDAREYLSYFSNNANRLLSELEHEIDNLVQKFEIILTTYENKDASSNTNITDARSHIISKIINVLHQIVENKKIETEKSVVDYDKLVSYDIYTLRAEESKTHDARLLYELGKRYLYGTRVEVDRAIGFALLQQSAEHGNLDAELEIAKCYFYGWGCFRSREQSYEIFKKFEEQGNKEAKEYIRELKKYL